MAAGASINDFHLGGYTPSAVLPPSQLTYLDKRADHTAGVLSAAFTLNLSAADAAQTAEFNIIYSQGPLDANGGLQPHPVSSAELPSRGLSGGPFLSRTSIVSCSATDHTADAARCCPRLPASNMSMLPVNSAASATQHFFEARLALPLQVQNGMAAQLDLNSGSGSTAVTDTTVDQTGINNPKVQRGSAASHAASQCVPRRCPTHMRLPVHREPELADISSNSIKNVACREK